MEKVKEIAYMDKGYNEKRKILRRYHFINPEVFELTNMVKHKILKRIKSNKFVDKKDIIDTLLVDGFIAYEKIYDKDDTVIDLNRVDPLTLTPEMEDGKILWHQNKGNNNARILYKTQILYVSSPNESFSSFVEMVYVNMINKDSKYTIKTYIDDMVECYNNNFLKI